MRRVSEIKILNNEEKKKRALALHTADLFWDEMMLHHKVRDTNV